MKTVHSMAKKWSSFLFFYVHLDFIPRFERWSMYKFYIPFTPTTQNQPWIPSYCLNTDTVKTTPEATPAQFIPQKPPPSFLHKVRGNCCRFRGTPWEECAQTISCLVNPRSQAQLLKTVTDLHGNSVCVALSTDRIPAPFTASLINPFTHS